MLADVRASVERLQQVEGLAGMTLRTALDLGGVTSDPGIAKLAEAAEAARRERDPMSTIRVNESAPPPQRTASTAQSFSNVLSMVLEATLEAYENLAKEQRTTKSPLTRIKLKGNTYKKKQVKKQVLLGAAGGLVWPEWNASEAAMHLRGAGGNVVDRAVLRDRCEFWDGLGYEWVLNP